MSYVVRAGILLAIVVAGLAVGDSVGANQAKFVDAYSLAAGQQRVIHASPQNWGAAMTQDVYWFTTTEDSATGFYRCRITSNATGRTLNVRMLDQAAALLGSCAAANGGTCSTPIRTLAGESMYTCLVATSAGNPVSASAHYAVAIQRCSSSTAC